MTTPSPRDRSLRSGSVLLLVMHLFLVGFVPASEALHGHEHGSDIEWHTDGSHQHGEDRPVDCPLLAGNLPVGIVTSGTPDLDHDAPLWACDDRSPATPRPSDAPIAVGARAPPAL